MSELTDARLRMQNSLGAAVAQKASDAFALRHGRPQVRARVYRSASPPVESAPTVLECESPVARPIDDIEIRETLRRTRQATAELFRANNGSADAPLLAAITSRGAIDRAENIFERHIRDVLVTLRHAAREPPRGRRTERQQTAGGVTRHGQLGGDIEPGPADTCWLNSCIRTTADVQTIAEVAADSRIQLLDVPRRLQREIGGTTLVVGAPSYRAAFGVEGRGIVVAVIDSEIADTHPTLANRVVYKTNYTTEPWGTPGTHGTAVAGIVASTSESLSGMSPAATIYNYKVLATLEANDGDDFAGSIALQQALVDGAHIANCSWGAGPATNGQSREAQACNQAWALGLVIVKSSGNGGTLTSPADADGIIVVGATDRSGQTVPNYSGRGATAHGARPHVVAPGGTDTDFVTSAVLSGGFGLCGRGTSFAAAHVSGLIALLLGRYPEWSPDEIRGALLQMCHPLRDVDENAQGQGLLRLI